MTAAASSNIRRNTSAEPAEDLAREAGILLDTCGVVRSRAWVSRAVRAFLNGPVQGVEPFGLYLAARVQLNDAQRRRLAERPDLRYLLTYSDPTGETAVRNVMRAERRPLRTQTGLVAS